jgi:uncharacterized protein YabN with tetrapyrrole methylase and pyrophosphatase domain
MDMSSDGVKTTMSDAMKTTKVCIKVSNLRKIGYNNLREWMADDRNVYVGRRGRVFIHRKDGIKTVYVYPQSIWHNPYKSGEHELKECLKLYYDHIFDSDLIYSISELRGKNLGCFCEGKECHAQMLADMIEKCWDVLKSIKT